MITRRHTFAAVAAAASLVMTACAGGGASDTVGAAAAAEPAAGSSTVNLFAYAVPKPGYDKLIPAFQATEAGKGVQFQQTYGASGDQSRKVEAGAEADFVNFSVEPDITRLVDAGLVDASWNANEHKGIPFGSVVTIVVREGNPKGIKDWDDLLQPGLEVVTPNPFSSGSAKWNLLAPYATKSNGGVDKDGGAGLHRLAGRATTSRSSRSRAARPPRPSSRARATCCSATRTRRCSSSATATRSSTSRRRRPSRSRTPPPWSPRARTPRRPRPSTTTSSPRRPRSCGRRPGFRPVDPTVAAEFAKDFPQPEKLWTIADLGGWKEVDSTLFKKDVGDIAKIYDAATQ